MNKNMRYPHEDLLLGKINTISGKCYELNIDRVKASENQHHGFLITYIGSV